MRLRINIYTFASAVFSIITVTIFFILSRLFSETIIFYLGIPFALSTFFFFQLLTTKDKQISFKIKTSAIDLALYLFTLISIATVLLIPPYTGSILEWMKIPLTNWLRLLSSMLLTTFLPGYFLLKILDRKNSISGTALIVLSYLLSIFITFLTGYSILLTNNSISLIAPQTILAVNLLLAPVHYLINIRRKEENTTSIDLTQALLLFSVLLTVAVGSLIIMYHNFPLTPGDMWGHHGQAIQYSERLPVYEGYPHLYHIYLGALFSISGIPLAITEQSLYILSFMPVLAFYSAVKTWFNGDEDKRIPTITLLLSALLGFGGIYALHLKLTDPTHSIIPLLRETTSKTYDVYMRFLYLPDIVAPIWNIGLPTFFSFLYFLKKNVDNITRVLIIPFLVTVGYMGHISEVIFFVIVLFVYTVFFRQKHDPKIGLYVALGLLIVSILDLAAPAQAYVLTRVGTTLSLPFISSVILAILTYIIETVKNKRSIDVLKKFKTKILFSFEDLWRYARWLLLYSYLFLLVIWLTVVDSFDVWAWGGYGFTPFFVLPVRLGSVGLLAIISLFAYLPSLKKDRNLLFFLSFIPLGFILEQLANYYPSILIYPSYRYGTLTLIGACVVASYGVIKTLNNKRGNVKFSLTKQKIAVSALFTVLLISGFLTTTLYYVNASKYHRGVELSQLELNALNYVRQLLPKNASVLTFTDQSSHRLRNFAGINAVQDAQRWSNLLLSTTNPYVITYILSLSNVKYIYVAQRDAELMNSNNVLSSFVKYFPIVFKNEYVTIYEVPPLTPQSSEASLGILHFSPSLQNLTDTMWIDDSFTEGWHPYRQYGEVKSYESDVRNGVMEISVTSNQSGTVWASYALSDLSLNTTTYSTLTFRYRVENDLSWFTLQLWNSSNKVFLYIGHLTDKELTTKTVPLPENQIITRIEIIVETVKDAPANTTACVYIDYIKFSPKVLSWKDDTFLRDWAFYKKYGNVYDWSAHSNGDILKINATSNQSGTVWTSYSLPLALKTKDSLLSFRYKVDNDYTWFTIILQNASHRFFFYKGHLTDKTFTTKSYSLPNDQIITKVEIIVETTDKAPPRTSAIAYIDYIEISPSPFSKDDVFPSLFASSLHSKYSVLYVDNVLLENLDVYLSRYTHILLTSDPPIPVETLSNWVSAGNTLTVLNSYGNGFFANLLGINSSSPLLSIKGLGLGKVLYVNSFPEVGKESELLQPEFLEKVKEALTLDEYVYRVNVLPVYNSTFGSIEIDGDLNICTDILMLQGSVNLTDPPFPFKKSAEIKIYGKVNLTIKNASLLVFPSESYMLIRPESYPVEGEVLLDGSETLIVADANVIYNSDMPVSFKFKTTGLSLYARLPSINASGTITFDQLDVHAALYIPLAGIVQQRAEIRGSVKFDTLYISNPLIMFSMFQADGEILNLAETTSRPTIPWAQVLTSPYNLTFNTIFVLGIAIYIAKKRKAKTTVNEKVVR